MKTALFLKRKDWLTILKLCLNSLPSEVREKYTYEKDGFSVTQKEIRRIVKLLTEQLEFAGIIDWVEQARKRIE